MKVDRVNTTTKLQAILITAYKDEENLIRLIRHFSDERHFRIYVHIDRRSSAIDERALEALGVKSLKCIRTYSIHWGSIYHMHAILDLMKMALEDPSIHYCHLLSGGDVALHSSDWYVREFSDCKISYCDMMPFSLREDWYLLYHWPSTLAWMRFSTRIDHVLAKIQRALGFRRRQIGEIPVASLSNVGLVWGSFTRDMCAEFVLFRDDNPKFVRALNYTRIPEELYFATIIAHKGFPISPNGYGRYSVWNQRGWPAVLMEEDFDDMYKDEYFVARKVDSEKSASLLKRIDEKIKLEGQSVEEEHLQERG